MPIQLAQRMLLPLQHPTGSSRAYHSRYALFTGPSFYALGSNEAVHFSTPVRVITPLETVAIPSLGTITMRAMVHSMTIMRLSFAFVLEIIQSRLAYISIFVLSSAFQAFLVQSVFPSLG